MPRRLALLTACLLLSACATKTVTVAASPAAASPSTASPTATTPAAHELRGTLDLSSYGNIVSIDSSCVGTGGYSDLQGGANVVVRDGAGQVVGTGTLGDGSGTSESGECKFSWTVDAVRDADFYTVGIANRKGPTFSRGDLAGEGWAVAMTIGDGS